MTGSMAFITVTFNSAKALERYWARAHHLRSEWIVVDNASSDESAEIAEGLGARVIRLPRNMGFSAANNVGASAATADCLLFVNPDVAVEESGARALARRALAERAIVAPQLLNADGSAQENGRSEPYLYRKFLHFAGMAASRAEYEILADVDETKEVSWVIGAAVAIPRDIFDSIGRWDAGFFVYYEDSDLCLRARRHGVRTLVDGNVRWTHGWARATRRTLSWRAWKVEVASASRFYRRYPRLLLHPSVVPSGSRDALK